MPRSYSSYDEGPSGPVDTTDETHAASRQHNDESGDDTPTSPRISRATRRTAASRELDERSGLLDNSELSGHYGYFSRHHVSTPGTPGLRRQYSMTTSVRLGRQQSRKEPVGQSFSHRLVNALLRERSNTREERGPNLHNSGHSFYMDDRVWYDQFTSIDWVHDNIADAFRLKALHARKDWRGRVQKLLDGVQGWVLVGIIGILTACVAYFVTVSENIIFDYKSGYCSYSWSASRKYCCQGASLCDEWTAWSDTFLVGKLDSRAVDYVAFVLLGLAFAVTSCFLTLLTKTVVPSNIQISTLDEDLGADDLRQALNAGAGDGEQDTKRSRSPPNLEIHEQPAMTYYPAAGSGVAEIKVIVSGFILHGYLGVRTLVIKSLALILSIASGLSIGKEGPYVHIATCVGNIVCRLFPKYRDIDAKRREILSASAASGVAVAFGAPLSGVLFSLEEVSYYFPSKVLFRTFFCCITAALSLKFLNPYGTNKIVLFEVRYVADWYFSEMFFFVLLGIMGGILGALFIKATRIWAQTFRRLPSIKKHPVLETALIALVTALLTFWSHYSRLPVTELLLELASPCDAYTASGISLCPTKDQIPEVLWHLIIAFLLKAFLTTITFGIKVPAGIYVPSMVVGGLLGRIVGHAVQYLALTYSHTGLFGSCSADSAPEDCVVPGVYALVAAGATMCGVTRLTVTLATILFELTGSLDHVLPFAIGVLAAKFTADALEPLSIYDLLTDMNSYPFLDNKVRPIFTSELGDMVMRHVRADRLIDISASVLVPANELRSKLEILHMTGEIDGGLPIVRDGLLVGLIPAPDLEFALDRLENEDKSLCLMSTDAKWDARSASEGVYAESTNADDDYDPTDFTAFIDPAPMSLDVKSPMDLVYECFVKLGLRYICVVRDGKYAGLVHKKTFVKYCRDLEHKSRKGRS